MPYTIQIGAIRCHILSDGLYVNDGGGFFGLVPRLLWERVIQPNERNQVPADSRSLLIESDAGLILVDCGHGDKMNARQRQIISLPDRNARLLGELRKVGYGPEAVDIVLMTHFHGDHIGGGTRWETAERAVPTFPRARYVAQRIDLAEASFPNERTRATYLPANWEPLLAHGQLSIVDGPQRLAPGVRTDVAPGHTLSIQTVWVENSGESLCFLTDACSWAAHLDRLAWVPSFDLYPMTSIETKRRLRLEAFERSALLVFQHDPRVVTGRLTGDAGGPVVQPEIVEEPWFDPTA